VLSSVTSLEESKVGSNFEERPSDEGESCCRLADRVRLGLGSQDGKEDGEAVGLRETAAEKNVQM
jgi:hypothetical protein